jgi:hypothetical protein
VSLSGELYARLAAYAANHHASDEQPNLAAFARDLLAQALANAEAQASNGYHEPDSAVEMTTAEERRQQAVQAFRARYAGHGRDRGTTGKAHTTRRQLVSTSVFNPHRHILGGLCERGHDYEGTGQSLRRITTLNCLECDKVTRRARQARDAGARS